MQQCRKDENARKRLERILSGMAKSTVVVEGNHDKDVLAKLGIKSITFDELLYSSARIDTTKQVCIVMDDDESGWRKEEKVIALLLEKGNELEINVNLGKSLLKLLGVRAVEEILEPVRRINENTEK
ncbi:MAG: hypothetical protein QXF41_02140 [Candidatus Micrarchaeaceae archaeon]